MYDLSIQLNDLGTCKRAVITRSSTTLVDCLGDKQKIEDRIEDLRHQASRPGVSENDRDVITSRLAKLSSGVAILRVGGATEIEMGKRRNKHALHETVRDDCAKASEV